MVQVTLLLLEERHTHESMGDASDGLLTLADDLASAPYRPTSAMLKVSVLKWKRGGIPKNNAPAPALTEPQSQIQQEMRTLSLSKFATMVKSKLDMQQI